MELYNISKLKLLTPVYYVLLADADPFGREGETAADSGRERIFCFELNETQYLSFEPDTRALFGALLFGGEAAGGALKETEIPHEKRRELPAGNYLFAQKREALSRDDITAMAAEIQQEGLWQRLKPGNTLYLRYLVEDSARVTQIFRPYSDSAGD